MVHTDKHQMVRVSIDWWSSWFFVWFWPCTGFGSARAVEQWLPHGGRAPAQCWRNWQENQPGPGPINRGQGVKYTHPVAKPGNRHVAPEATSKGSKWTWRRPRIGPSAAGTQLHHQGWLQWVCGQVPYRFGDLRVKGPARNAVEGKQQPSQTSQAEERWARTTLRIPANHELGILIDYLRFSADFESWYWFPPSRAQMVWNHHTFMKPPRQWPWTVGLGFLRQRISEATGLSHKLLFSSDIMPASQQWCLRHQECDLIASEKPIAYTL